jgi:hypothetical protein
MKIAGGRYHALEGSGRAGLGNPFVDVSKDTTTLYASLYASDRDVFLVPGASHPLDSLNANFF